MPKKILNLWRKKRKRMSNYKVLFCLRVLKCILTTFVDSFLVLYFLELSDSNILPLGIYKLVAVAVIFFTIFSVRNIAKSKYRVTLLRIGIILDFLYFLTILLLREKVVDYIYLVGVLYGLEEGFYFSVYNMFESDGIANQERAKFKGTYTAVKSILDMIFPLFMGTYIFTAGFLNAVLIVLAIVAIRIVLSFQFKDNNLPTENKTNLKEYSKIVNKEISIRKSYKMEIYNGLTYSEGAFSSIVMIYIIKIFSNSFRLGIFTAVFSMVTVLLGMLFAKVMKPQNYSRNIKISTIFTVTSLFIMIVNCNMFTVVLFNFLQTISKNLTEMINSNNQFDLSNQKELRKQYKVEYFVGLEFSIFIGRVISQSLFILMAFIENTTIMMIVFAMLLILYELNSVELNNEMQDNEKYTLRNVRKEEYT